jgi:arginine decarboxylase
LLDWQAQAPLFEALLRHTEKNTANLHIPGHRQGRVMPKELLQSGNNPFIFDLTELPGLDDLHNPQGAIQQAQELAAGLYGADCSYFLVNGTSTGLQALLMAVAGQKKVIIPRNAHRSVFGGLILAGAEPVYVMPELLPEFGLDCGVAPAMLKQALAVDGSAAVLAVNPNYYGISGDLPGQVAVSHQADKSFLVDEAHGAHLRFHTSLPQDAMTAGADAAVQSTHKLGGSLGQSSVLHLKGPRIERQRIAAALRLLQTTSPSYLLMASLDLARRQLALKGNSLLSRSLELAWGLRRRLSRIKGLTVLSPELLPGHCAMDPGYVVISVRDLGLSGYQVQQLLAERYQVFVEMADSTNVLAIVSIGTSREDCQELAGAMEDIAVRERTGRSISGLTMPTSFKVVLKPREAWYADSCPVNLEEAAGKISAESVAVYPPGIPVINPGEEVTGEILDYLQEVRQKKIACQGLADPTLKTIRVVVE